MGERWIGWEKMKGPRVHCLTNPVTMQDMANLLLASGGSAIMAQACEEVEEITDICHATLLNMGVPDPVKVQACILAGKAANRKKHPLVLDPVGVGASGFRREQISGLLSQVKVDLIRCNQEEARVLLEEKQKRMDPEEVWEQMAGKTSGGVESNLAMDEENHIFLTQKLAQTYHCAVLVSGVRDVVSDGTMVQVIEGGDRRISRITGSGCMLSALCALFCGAGCEPAKAAVMASSLWKEAAVRAGKITDEQKAGIGSFHMFLFDEIDRMCCGEKGLEK